MARDDAVSRHWLGSCRALLFDTMNYWKMLLPVLALMATLGVAGADEKKAQLSYYYLDG